MSDALPTVKHLLRTLEDSREGYAHAAQIVQASALRTLLEGFSAERQEMLDELIAFGDADPADSHATLGGTIRHGWMDFKAALTAEKDHAILGECVHADEHAAKDFDRALDREFPPELRSTIESISLRIQSARRQIEALREAGLLPDVV